MNLVRIGQLLREAREMKGISLDEVSQTLFIRKRVIEAIEAGDWDHLPDPVYVKGYVRQYALFLDILDILVREMASDGVESPGPESGHKRKKWVLRRWPFRKKKGQAKPSVPAPWSVIDQL